jgi:ABC-type lipoprotein release transport system permease subunit
VFERATYEAAWADTRVDSYQLYLALSAAVPVLLAALAAGYYPVRVASRHALANALAYE